MTVAQLNGSLLRLETGLALSGRDARDREAAIAELTRLLGVVDSLNRGGPPGCQVAHAIVAQEGEGGAVITELLECRHGRRDR
jgi:hypothetical protein